MKLNIKPKLYGDIDAKSDCLITKDLMDSSEDTSKDLSLLEIHNFNMTLSLKNIFFEKYLSAKHLSSQEYRRELEHLLNMDQGGFEHGDLSGLYVAFQNSPRYSSTRLCGWKNLLDIAFSSISKRAALKDGLIIDFLAGSGTLSKRARQLEPFKSPTVIGLDVSKRMTKQALKHKETVFWASHKTHFFKDEIADVAVAAYGFHHVPLNERDSFVASMQKTLKKDGLCIIHDFEEGSATARWYSEVIHQYRTAGHPYSHVTYNHLQQLLIPYFKETEIKYLYDPFYLVGNIGQDAQSLKQEFYSYLIGLFNLEKLVPHGIRIENLNNYMNSSYWESIDNLLSPFFILDLLRKL